MTLAIAGLHHINERGVNMTPQRRRYLHVTIIIIFISNYCLFAMLLQKRNYEH